VLCFVGLDVCTNLSSAAGGLRLRKRNLLKFSGFETCDREWQDIWRRNTEVLYLTRMYK
jgi:hypothetical protein